jgi:integrase
LGMRKSDHEEHSALLAGQPLEALYQASGKVGWHPQEHRSAHLPPFLRYIAEANGEDVKTVQELLRHANSKITLGVYTQAVNSHKRAAQSKVVRMIVPDVGTKRNARRTATGA